jgi:hypothetical protein
VLRLLPGAGKRLGESIREVVHDQPAAVLTEVDPEANGCLTWRPGQQQPEAITPPESDGSALCGCFHRFVPEQDADAGQVFEDGFLLMLTADSWHSLREAITSGHPLELPPRSRHRRRRAAFRRRQTLASPWSGSRTST